MLIRLTIAAAFGALSFCHPAQADGDRHMTCPRAQVLCVQELGYNYQECGRLPGRDGRPQEFPTCYDWDEATCTPCWHDTVAGTVAQCQRRFGYECSYFFLQNERWDEWGDVPDAIEGTVKSRILMPSESWLGLPAGGPN